MYYDPTEDEEQSAISLDPQEQRLRVRIEKKGRGGKVATIIDGYEGLGMNDLARTLKSKLGLGGSVKEGLIILQGDVRQKCIELLKSMGYKDSK